MAAIGLTVAALPTAVANTSNPFGVAPSDYRYSYTVAKVLGLKAGAEANGRNSAAYTFTGSGGADTIANVELLKGVEAGSPLAALLTISYATQADLDATLAAVGFMATCTNGSNFKLVTAAPGVPTATVTTAAAPGALRMSIASSITA